MQHPTVTRTTAGIEILCFSWNVGNAMPNPEELSQWLPITTTEHPWDLVVVGTQENSFKAKKDAESSFNAKRHGMPTAEGSVASMGASTEELEEPEKPAPESSWTQKEHEKDAALWDQMVRKQLGSAYKLVSHVVLWQMRLSVYAKAIHVQGPAACIHHVRTAISATGVGGFMGNKGGLVVKLDFGSTSLVFVSGTTSRGCVSGKRSFVLSSATSPKRQ